MLVWDDLDPSQRLSVYDKGVDMDESLDETERKQLLISYRVGDMVAPALPEQEALAAVVDEFVSAIRTGTPPPTDGAAGLRVVEILAAAQRSVENRGQLVTIGDHE
jgi:predicted dehydrogenase